MSSPRYKPTFNVLTPQSPTITAVFQPIRLYLREKAKKGGNFVPAIESIVNYLNNWYNTPLEDPRRESRINEKNNISEVHFVEVVKDYGDPFLLYMAKFKDNKGIKRKIPKEEAFRSMKVEDAYGPRYDIEFLGPLFDKFPAESFQENWPERRLYQVNELGVTDVTALKNFVYAQKTDEEFSGSATQDLVMNRNSSKSSGKSEISEENKKENEQVEESVHKDKKPLPEFFKYREYLNFRERLAQQNVDLSLGDLLQPEKHGKKSGEAKDKLAEIKTGKLKSSEKTYFEPFSSSKENKENYGGQKKVKTQSVDKESIPKKVVDLRKNVAKDQPLPAKTQTLSNMTQKIPTIVPTLPTKAQTHPKQAPDLFNIINSSSIIVDSREQEQSHTGRLSESERILVQQIDLLQAENDELRRRNDSFEEKDRKNAGILDCLIGILINLRPKIHLDDTSQNPSLKYLNDCITQMQESNLIDVFGLLEVLKKQF